MPLLVVDLVGAHDKVLADAPSLSAVDARMLSGECCFHFLNCIARSLTNHGRRHFGTPLWVDLLKELSFGVVEGFRLFGVRFVFQGMFEVERVVFKVCWTVWVAKRCSRRRGLSVQCVDQLCTRVSSQTFGCPYMCTP